jgi:hypothetical protein
VHLPYERAEVIVDGIGETLTGKWIGALFKDLQHLYNLSLDALTFKIFVPSIHLDKVSELDCVRQGRVPVLLLPEWTEGELRQLLAKRLVHLLGPEGEFEENPDIVLPEYGRRLRPFTEETDLFSFVARRVFENMNEEDTAKLEDILGAPVHTLKLARGLLALLAGCFKDEEPFEEEESADEETNYYTKDQLEEVVRAYFKHEKGGS